MCGESSHVLAPHASTRQARAAHMYVQEDLIDHPEVMLIATEGVRGPRVQSHRHHVSHTNLHTEEQLTQDLTDPVSPPEGAAHALLICSMHASIPEASPSKAARLGPSGRKWLQDPCLETAYSNTQGSSCHGRMAHFHIGFLAENTHAGILQCIIVALGCISYKGP